MTIDQIIEHLKMERDLCNFNQYIRKIKVNDASN